MLNRKKILYLISIFLLVIAIFISGKTLARFVNHNTTTSTVWNGTVAEKYRKGTGTIADPYIISSGNELAYFASQSLINDYSNTYFELKNDIILNDGVFNYDSTTQITYTLNDTVYYIKEYTNEYYENNLFDGNVVENINIFNSIDNFKGFFNGNSYTIYGLYITSDLKNNLGLFTNLSGNVSNLNVENALIYGGIKTGGIASSCNDASISNTIFNGYVIGKKDNIRKTINIIKDSLSINLTNSKSEIVSLDNDYSFVGTNIISSFITGNYSVTNSNGSEIIKINNNIISGGNFNISLDTSILDNFNITVETTSTTPIDVLFTNVSYNITYDYAISGGISASSNNTIFTNVINKGNVYAKSISAGITSYLNGNSSINSSYNTGIINSDNIVGGLIGVIDKNDFSITLSNSYNSNALEGLNNGGLINTINNSANVSIINCFYTNNVPPINNLLNTNVTVNNSYQIYNNPITNGTIIGNFNLTTLDNLKNENYDINNLFYNKFISLNDLDINPLNVWIYQNDELPKLYLDDDSSSLVTIHASTYSWNNLSETLNNIYLNDNITFSIEQSSIIKPLKNIYYYLSNSKTLLSLEELNSINNWITYEDVTTITTSGNYVIYVKAIDINDNITYLNSDLLLLNMIPIINININDASWNNLKNNFDYYYIDTNKEFNIVATDSISSPLNIKYMISNNTYTKEQLDNMDDSKWNNYTENTIVNENKYIIYCKVTNLYNDVFYTSTDYIILNGYSNSYLFLGRNNNYENNNMTDKSSLTTNYTYHSEYSYGNSYNHNLLSNLLLPIGTKITLIDKIFNKTYYYEITTNNDYGYNNSCNNLDSDCVKYAIYPFTLFKESGSTNISYIENNYYQNGEVNENFDVIVDFNNALFDKNYLDIWFKLKLINENSSITTLTSDLKKVNIYNNSNNENTSASLYLTSDYKGNVIEYSTDSITNIVINTGLSYKMINNEKIIDTTFENKNITLAIKMVNENNDIISYENLKNIYFEVDGIEYYPENDGITRINLNNGMENTIKTLKIITKSSSVNLNEGTYYLKISNYASYNGEYSNMTDNNILSIPVIVKNVIKDYGFDVIMNANDRIIEHDIINKTIHFGFELSNLKNPKITISLYKKDELTAYNQDYSLINIKDYITNELLLESNNSYILSLDNNLSFDLFLITTNLENTGYKYVFDLYDDNNKISSITKYFIVR